MGMREGVVPKGVALTYCLSRLFWHIGAEAWTDIEHVLIVLCRHYV
jgi:hypothetical protein